MLTCRNGKIQCGEKDIIQIINLRLYELALQHDHTLPRNLRSRAGDAYCGFSSPLNLMSVADPSSTSFVGTFSLSLLISSCILPLISSIISLLALVKRSRSDASSAWCVVTWDRLFSRLPFASPRQRSN